MKKVLLFMAATFAFGCSPVAKSDFFNAIDSSSISDTINNLTETQQVSSKYQGNTLINNESYEVWDLGENVSVLSDSDQSIVAYHRNELEVEEVETILNDYDFKMTTDVEELLDKNEKTLDRENLEFFLKDDYITVTNDDVVIIVTRRFNVPKLEEYYKKFVVTVYYDKILAEVAKSDMLK